jgi:amidohydrolase
MPKGQDPAKAAPHHTPDFVVDDAGMKTGIQAFCAIITEYLQMK